MDCRRGPDPGLFGQKCSRSHPRLLGDAHTSLRRYVAGEHPDADVEDADADERMGRLDEAPARSRGSAIDRLGRHVESHPAITTLRALEEVGASEDDLDPSSARMAVSSRSGVPSRGRQVRTTTPG